MYNSPLNGQAKGVVCAFCWAYILLAYYGREIKAKDLVVFIDSSTKWPVSR